MQDEQSLLFGGTDAPCAIAQLDSIGSMNLENNRAFSAAFSALIAEHGIPEDRYVSEHPSFCVTHALLCPWVSICGAWDRFILVVCCMVLHYTLFVTGSQLQLQQTLFFCVAIAPSHELHSCH